MVTHFERLAQSLAMALSLRQATEAQRESEERLRDVIDLSPAGYFRIDREGCFQSVNDAWLRMHGFDSPHEVIGKHFSMVQVEEDRLEAQRCVGMMLAGEKIASSGTFSRKCRDGSIGYHTFSVRPVMQGSEIIGLEGFFIDRTDQQRIELVKEFLAKTSSGAQNESFFNVLARYLAQSLGTDLVRIARLEGDGLARTLAVWCDGRIEDNFTYALKDKPCGEVVGKGHCCIPTGISRLIPSDHMLQDMRADG